MITFKQWLFENDDEKFSTRQFDPTKSRDFLGYHASKSSQPRGVVDPMYGSHFRELLDSMPWEYRDYALKQGWLDADIEDDDHTSKEIANWLSRENIGMIFVSHDQPYVDSLNLRRKGSGATYGHNAFYVMLPEKDRLAQIIDPGEIDASIVLYNRNNPPKFIPI